MKMECAEWKQEIPEVFSKDMELSQNENRLLFRFSGNRYGFGKYVCFSELNDMEKRYRMVLTYHMKAKKGKLAAYLTFYQKDRQTVTRREYLTKGEDGKLSITFRCREEEQFVKTEISFSGFGAGQCEVEIPCFEMSDGAKSGRKVKVATTFFWSPGSMDGNFKRILEIIDAAGTALDKPDILCFTETVYDRGVRIPFADKFVPEKELPLSVLQKRAEQYHMYLLFSAHAIDEEHLRRNTAYLISPEGEEIRKYNKTHLTMAELENGVVPGNELPVFDTFFGKIGILICWDQWFPEAARTLQLKGAEIIFWQTAGYNETKLRARAMDSAAYIVTACDQNPGFCNVTDPDGTVIERLYDFKKGYHTVAIDVDKKFYEAQLSVGDAYGSGKNIYPNERRGEIYQTLIQTYAGDNGTGDNEQSREKQYKSVLYMEN